MENKLQQVKFVEKRKLAPEDAQQIPPWLRHFLIHVVKCSAMLLVTWIDDVKEANRKEWS